MLKFPTGIYDYAVMTSVFSAVEGGRNGSFELRKLTLSAQEWCGQVYDEVQVRGGRLEGQLNSYFEREGRHSYVLPLPPDFASEDHLLIRIRELRGPIMVSGEEVEVALLPRFLVSAPAAPSPSDRSSQTEQAATGDHRGRGAVFRGHSLALGYG